MTILQLFLSFFHVGLFSIGGGMAAMPLIQEQVVSLRHWLTLTEFTDLITIAEMTPGPITINSATFVGIRIAGLPGALIATLGSILPGCIIVSILAWLYFRYQRLSAGISIFILAIWGEQGFRSGLDAVNWIAVGLFAAAFFVLRKWKPSPIWVMLGAGAVGGALYLLV